MNLDVREDDDLIRRAELWATGATIHDVKGLIGLYRSAIGALGQADRWSARKMLYVYALRDVAVARLEAFMATGDYRKATAANPLPVELPENGTPTQLAEYHRWTLYAARQWLYDIGESDLAESLRPVVALAVEKGRV